MLSYTRSHHRSRVTQLISIFLKAHGLSARGFDALHSWGFIMSHKWTANAFATIASRAMLSVVEMFHSESAVTSDVMVRSVATYIQHCPGSEFAPGFTHSRINLS